MLKRLLLILGRAVVLQGVTKTDTGKHLSLLQRNIYALIQRCAQGCHYHAVFGSEKNRHYWKIHCNSFFLLLLLLFYCLGSYYVALGGLELIVIHLSPPPKHWHILLCLDFSFILFERLH